jgi:hypothetical protein
MRERCNAELDLEGDGGPALFICGRPKGHTLVHADTRGADDGGVPPWSIVWAADPEVVAGEVIEPPASVLP